MNSSFVRVCGVVLLGLCTGCSQMQRPTVRDVRARVTGLDIQGAELVFDVDIENHYPIAIPSPKFTYALDIEDHEFIKSERPVTANLPAGAVGTATLPIRVTFVELWKMYSALSNAPELRYRLKSDILMTVMGQSFALPVNHEGKLPVLRMPSFRPGKPAFNNVSLSGAVVTLPVEVNNPNVFPLDVRDLGYDLTLGETRVGGISATTSEPIPPRTSETIMLSGRVTATSAIRQVMTGASLGAARLMSSGEIKTPYGPVRISSQKTS